MTIRNLDRAFRPQTVAVLGASTRKGSVGRVVYRNILDGGFSGPVWPVNPKYDSIDGARCFARVGDLPEAPDLAVIVTPRETVPGLIEELDKAGTRAALVITAGLTRENGLRQKMLDASRPYLLRIIGPESIGVSVPPIGLDLSVSHLPAKPGRISLITQSGAIGATLIDWAAERGIGFSHVIGLGDSADVDLGDCLDLIAGEGGARAGLALFDKQNGRCAAIRNNGVGVGRCGMAWAKTGYLSSAPSRPACR